MRKAVPASLSQASPARHSRSPRLLGLLEAEMRTLPSGISTQPAPLPVDMFSQSVHVHLTLLSTQLRALINSDVSRHLPV